MHKTSAWPLALIYAALIVFASLFPFDGWRSQGVDPLVFQEEGRPYRAFLEGRVRGEEYLLLMHLSNLELKPLPEAAPAATPAAEPAA